MEKFFKRIGYKGKLEAIANRISRDYDLGKLESTQLIETGYEDFNFRLDTNKGKYFVKVFANFRTPDDCKRYIDVVSEAIKHKIQTPVLYESNQGQLHIMDLDDVSLRLCVMEFVEGDSFYEKRILPNEEEVRLLARQATLINTMDIKPALAYDSWAIVNFPKEYAKRGKYLSSQDREIIAPLLKEYKALCIDKLPHCFVHGDIITTNVISANAGKRKKNLY